MKSQLPTPVIDSSCLKHEETPMTLMVALSIARSRVSKCDMCWIERNRVERLSYFAVILGGPGLKGRSIVVSMDNPTRKKKVGRVTKKGKKEAF